MKLANMLMILIVIQATIIMYDQVFAGSDPELTPYGSNDTALWDFVTNPVGWTATDFLQIFTGLVAVAGAIGIGVYMVTKSDTAMFYPVFALLLGAGAVPIVSLYNVITRDPAIFGCVDGASCPLSIFVWTLTGGVLSLFYFLSCLEWWSGRSTG